MDMGFVAGYIVRAAVEGVVKSLITHALVQRVFEDIE